MPRLTIRLFGYPQILVDSIPIKVERRKTLALVAYLALNSGFSREKPEARVCGRETLAALFWPENSQDQASAYLRQSLWDFGKSAGEDWIIKNSQFACMNPEADICLDAGLFENRLAQWKSGHSAGTEVMAILKEAVDLYQSDFLSGFSLRDCPAFDDWQAFQSERFKLHLAEMLEALVHLCSIEGKHKAAVSFGQRWLDLDPLNEAAHRALIRLYAEKGQHNAALRQYDTCQKVLLDELGVEPEAETTALYRSILDGTFQAQKFAPWNKESREQANLTPKSARDRPAGTVTFLFTDIEGSTQLWESYPDAMPAAFARHEAIIRSTMETHSGFVYKMVGDAFQVAFTTAPDALAAAIDTQRALLVEPWGEVGSLKVRIALHTGVTEERGDDYVGPTLNRAARLLNAGYGGQILLNQSTFELVHDRLPPGIFLQDLGKHYLKDIANPEHIYQPAGPGLAPGFPPLRTAGTRPIHLPVQATPFIGRKNELAKLETMVGDPECRLITLVGIGGSGKTRLSIQAAEQSVGFPHGIYFAGLANITSLEDMILAIAEAVRVTLHAPPGRSLSLKEAQDQLLQSLAETKSLIVLDNFEQLIPCAQFLSELLDAAPGVKLIVTSRERLNIPEEWILEVIGLSFPGRLEDEEILEYPAVQLFIKCAERSGNFTATADDWKAIARICQLVEGVPLAVEMAAAWVKVFSCPEIAAEIERDLDFLAATWRGMPERHQTLRAVFEHSWRLLSESVQEVFCRLAVFRSGFPREAALEVAGASLHVLTDLVDKSFVRRKSSGRFEIHPVLKQYATQKLAENTTLHTETRFRHAVYYCKWLDCMNEQLVGSEQLTALFALRTETQNLRSAWQFLVEKGDFERLKIILPAVVLFYVMNDQRVETQEVIQLLHDTIHLLRNAVDQLTGEPTGSLPACTYQGLLALSLATLRHFSFDPMHIELTHPYQIESLKLVDPLPDCQEKAYTILLNCTKAGNLTYSRTIDYCQECIGIFERMGNVWGVAMTKLILADSALFGGKDFSLARASYQSSLEGFTMLGNNWGKALCLSGFSLVERREGNLEKAYELGYESFKIYDQMNSAERVQDLRLRLGEIADKLGRIEDARRFFEANLAYYIKIGDIERQRLIKEWLEKLGKGEIYYRGLDVP